MKLMSAQRYAFCKTIVPLATGLLRLLHLLRFTGFFVIYIHG